MQQLTIPLRRGGARPSGPWGMRFDAAGRRVKLNGEAFACDVRGYLPPRPGKKIFAPSKYERREGREAHTFVCLDARGRGVRWSVFEAAVARGWEYFWNRPQRAHLPRPPVANFLIKHYHAHD